MAKQRHPIVLCGVLRTAVGVVDAPWRRFSALDGSSESGERQADVDRAAEGIADRLARPGVEDHRDVGEAPEFRREVQPPASPNGLDVPSRRAVFVPWKPSRRRGFGMGTRLSVEEPMLSTGLHLTSESTTPFAFSWQWFDPDEPGHGHMMVAVGYNTINGVNYLTVEDPLPVGKGNERVMTYSEYVSAPGQYTHWNDYYDVK
jgi:hypothetical protein